MAWWWPFAAAGVGLLLSLPALHVGWVGDDYWHRYVLDPDVDPGELGIIETDSVMYLFSFLDGDRERNARLEHDSLRWLQCDGERYVPFTPPEIGESIRLQ